MRYAQIREIDIANGVGIRTSLYVQGCTRGCKGCFNPETWSFEGGKPFTEEIKNKFIELTGRPHIVGTTILGGEPMHPDNRAEVTTLCRVLKDTYPQKSIWMYSSYTFEELMKDKCEVLQYVDVLVDGVFVEELKDFKLKFRGSSNQRIIDVCESLKNSEAVVLENF